MSISFNGIASGLDTSSWVESLTALKRAKISSLEESKKAVNLSKDTLSSIKSLFNSFSSAIQKVTDIKFNVGTMNVFAQNTAKSSDSKIFTATATSDALEGSYDISVEKLASYTTASSKFRNLSAANYANTSTKLKDLNITPGSFSLFKDGEKFVIQIEENETIGSLSNKVSNYGIGMSSGSNITFYTDTGSGVITAGANTDTSNISSVLGLHPVSNEVHSSRKMFRVSGNSILTDTGLFRRGNVTQGTFTIGNAEFEITNKTTLNDLISQINSSNDSYATAYWDSANGNLVLKSKTTGSAFINIEAGTSNFTDILGFTASGKLNTSYQELGDNATFAINGTEFTSSSNIVTSDISRIAGVTITLKDVSSNDVTLTIEKDVETASNAMLDIVNAYNTLIENVDKEIDKGGNLKDQSTLKMIRNKLRNLMVNSYSNDGIFKNLSSIGITTEAASSGNISTDNISKLSFSKDTFTNAFKTNPYSLKDLLIGDEDSKGVFIQVEDLLESTLKTSGYFDSAERNYNDKISRLNDKITKQTTYADRYKERLEKKFQTMDLLISKIQQQYSSFLGS